MAYIRGETGPTDARRGTAARSARPRPSDDAEGLIVHRGEHCYVVLNLFPYNPGHLLVCPYRHVAALHRPHRRGDGGVRRADQGRRCGRSGSVVRRRTGFNIGMNQGAVAGAGIAAHLHQHVVPRWGGDSNFLPVIAQTKALPMLLEDVRQQLVASWPR